MKKILPAILAAGLMIAILGAGMFSIGQNSSLFVRSAAAEDTAPTATQSVDLDTLQNVVMQYQQRESQYQQQLQDAADRINSAEQQLAAANQQVQQYQQLLADLQNQGLITLGADGTVTINQMTFAEPRERHARP